MIDEKDFSTEDSTGHDLEESKTPELIKNRGLTSQQSIEIKHLFENVYINNKWRVIRMNFLRGLAFGFGAFIGGTIVVAVIAWLLIQTVDLFPWAKDFTERLINALQN